MPGRRNAVYFLIILSLLGGLFTGQAIFFSISYFFGLLIPISWLFAWSNLHGIGLARQTRSRRAQVGKTLDEQFTIRNLWILPKVGITLFDHSNVPGHQPSFVIDVLTAWKPHKRTIHTLCMVRGEFTLGPFTLVSSDPVGLFRLRQPIEGTSKIIVYPASAPVTAFSEPIGILSGGDAQRQRALITTTNAAGIRDYAPGDSLNRIHWKSTARRGQLLVKEFDLDPLAATWLILDLSEQSLVERPYSVDVTAADLQTAESGTFIPPSTHEYAIVAASSLTTYFLGKERNLGFITYAPRRTHLAPDRGPRQNARILEALALARFESDMPAEKLLAHETHALGRGTTVVFVTADMGDGWIKEASLLRRLGMKVIAVIIDPVTFGEPNARSADETRLIAQVSGIATYVVRQGDDIATLLSQRGV